MSRTLHLSGDALMEWDRIQCEKLSLRQVRDEWLNLAEDARGKGYSQLASQYRDRAQAQQAILDTLDNEIAGPSCLSNPGKTGDAMPDVPASPTKSNVVDLSTRTGDVAELLFSPQWLKRHPQTNSPMERKYE